MIETPATPFTPATPGLLQSASKKPSRVDREEMRSQFAALPAPQNEYGVSVPEEEEAEAAAPEEAEDVEAIERQIREEEEAMEKEELARRSEVLKRGLPRGNVLGARFVVGSAGVEKELKEEVNRIVAYEDFKYPSAESTRKYTEEVTLAPLAREDRLAAEVLVMEEEGDLKAAQAAQQENTEENSEENTENSENTEEAFWRLWLAGEADLVYDPAAKEVVHAGELTEVRERVRSDEIGGKSGMLSPCVLVPAEADHEADEACAEEREEAEPCAGRVSGKTEESRVAIE